MTGISVSPRVETEIIAGLKQLGYRNPRLKIHMAGGFRYIVIINRNQFGIWDDLKKTFVD